jgi:hypothetical protein
MSAREVYDAWISRKEIAVTEFEAWKMVPTQESSTGSQPLAPLFKLGPGGRWEDLERRDKLQERTTWTFTKDWSAADTLAAITASGLWKYPMQLNP